MLAIVTVLALGLCGACTQENPSGTGVVNHEKEKPAEGVLKNQPFDPRITVKWPTAPEESRSKPEEPESYTAIAVLRRESSFATFKLAVTLHPKDPARKSSAKDLLESQALIGKDEETSRRQLELSTKKHPALKISKVTKGAKGRQIFSREIVFVAGDRLGYVSVGGSNEAYINGQEVDAFLKSLKIED
jgi:hypothetical protein